MKRAAAVLALAACSHAAPHNVTIEPTQQPTASAVDAGDDATYTGEAHSAFEAAEALQRDGKKKEAREAFAELVRKFAYTRYARESELRIAQIDNSPTELEKWAHDHPSDPRAAEIVAKLATVGDVTCSTDADCTVTTKRDCCECCPRRALATSKKWLEWRDTQQCAVVRCAGCDESCKPETGASATCNAGKCELTKK